PMIAAALNTCLPQSIPGPNGAARTGLVQDNDAPAARDRAIRPLYQVERDAIEAAIDRCGGNIPQAAVALGVAPSTLYRKIQSWKDVS
ncbi:MAG TPA: sigma-54-dependent Fis family transcriptional regulator, partial [Rhodospirillaceae bacterium]|nr:sigma-54-dependent Fis family transcriptional regulator [Rhodospirillaceae bacterium]